MPIITVRNVFKTLFNAYCVLVYRSIEGQWWYGTAPLTYDNRRKKEALKSDPNDIEIQWKNYTEFCPRNSAEICQTPLFGIPRDFKSVPMEVNKKFRRNSVPTETPENPTRQPIETRKKYQSKEMPCYIYSRPGESKVQHTLPSPPPHLSPSKFWEMVEVCDNFT
jgi:hypothetical protein